MSKRDSGVTDERAPIASAGGMSGVEPGDADVHAPRSRDGIITSSGSAPTGGVPAGGASDRSIPEIDVRRSASATGEKTIEE